MTNFPRGGSRGRVQGYGAPPPPPEITCGFLVQLVFGRKKLGFVGVEVKHEIACVQTLPLSPQGHRLNMRQG